MDIDGTLVKGNKAHLEAFNYIFRTVFRVKEANIKEIEHPGLTDELIIKIIMKRHGIEGKIIEEKIDEAKELMIRQFELNLSKYPVSIIPGAREFLERVKKDNILGLITGNLEGIAKIKLLSVDLWHYFPIGGFGSDDMDRAKLLEIAIKRAEKLTKIKFQRENIYVFGDTWRDIEAAKKLNLRGIGIAGGNYSEAILKDSGAVRVYKNFLDIKKIREDLGI
jgi:phosphoglycolate phosphatase-like HAD superfamily hydrolase